MDQAKKSEKRNTLYLPNLDQNERSINISKLTEKLVEGDICTGCGACIGIAGGRMIQTKKGCIPNLPPQTSKEDAELIEECCPGMGINYLEIYNFVYGKTPENWTYGVSDQCWVGNSSNQTIRKNGASGGIITTVLCYLLENKLIDAAIVAKQGLYKPEEASYRIAESVEEIQDSAQSVYVPVSMLDSLIELEEGKKYAITCLPDQAAALRKMQMKGHTKALQVKYLLGPYTGTALEPGCIRALLRSHGVQNEDQITSLKWRAGEWPGYLEIKTESGKRIMSPKIYYNFLIPFFITSNSLQNIDFGNEFCDLSVGDAWSPKYESKGNGYSAITSRKKEMTKIIERMHQLGLIEIEPVDSLTASEMHGHMIDFKKRGGSIRNKFRYSLGKKAPLNDIYPIGIPLSRYAVEIIISGIFAICRTSIARKIIEFIPESILGPIFNQLRLTWKTLSKPTKRKGLKNLRFKEQSISRTWHV